MTAETTGQRIRRTRTAAGLTQAAVATDDMTAKNVGRIERGEIEATPEQLAALADALETTADYLATGKLEVEIPDAPNAPDPDAEDSEPDQALIDKIERQDADEEPPLPATAGLGLDPEVAADVELRLAAALRGTRFPSIEEFYSDDERRRLSPEVDYGVQWVAERTSWPQYRVSWIEATGEVYAVRLGRPDSVEVIGWAATRDAAEEALEGWENLPVRDSVVGWARDQFAGDPFPLDPGDDPEAES